MKKKIILFIFTILLISGCTPKMGTIYQMQELKSKVTSKVSIIRNYSVLGSEVRFYPTVNKQKVVGLYLNDYTSFYLKEGTYTFGLLVPDLVFASWIKENSIEKELEANKHYYFLVSPTFSGHMEIEEIEKKEGEERISSSTFIGTGNSGVLTEFIRPLSDLIGLNKDEEEKRQLPPI